MDIPRPQAKGRRRLKRILYGIVVIVVIGGITIGVSQMKPAAPPIDDNVAYKGTVMRGPDGY